MTRRVIVAVGFALFVGAVSLLLAAQGCTGNEATCPAFSATNYDHSCKVDSDCIAVLEQGFCCPSAAIKVDAQSQYMADFDKASAACATKGCNGSCPATGAPCCRKGTCELGLSRCAPPVTAEDAGDDADADGPAACIAAGGECLVGGFRSDCALVGPQDCNPELNPGGSYCCLKKASVADAATDGADAVAE